MTGHLLSDGATEYRDTNVADVSTALVMQFAEETGADVHDLPPLYRTIDSEALNRLLDGAGDGVRVSFEYCGHRIDVTGDGDVTIEALD